jgi:hypothetical protein
VGRLVCALLACALALPAQLRMTVEQLMGFIKSSVQLKHDDRKVAEYVHKIKLANKLSLRTVEELQSMGAGPKTVDALKDLSAASNKLPDPPKPQPKPAPVLIPPPSLEDQKKLIEEVRNYALTYTKQLPNFICNQVTRRYDDPTGADFWRQQDVVNVRLSFNEQKEDYKVITVNGRMTDIAMEKLGGTISTGEFGSMMKEIFEPSTEAAFGFERWTTWRGRRTLVFNYRVEKSRSQYHVVAERTQDYVPAYHGLIYVDRDTTMVMRLTMDINEFPVGFPIQEVHNSLDYDFQKIGDHEYVLPLRAEVRSRSGRAQVKNEVEFRMYRKFGAEASITFDTPEPLPDSVTKEQPIKP